AWTAIASGLPNGGSYVWTVPAQPSLAARVRVTAHDPASNLGRDSSDAVFEIRAAPVAKLVSFRADGANGSGPDPAFSAGSPWVDLWGHGHGGALAGFLADASSGWRGSGTPVSPRRLECGGEDALVRDRVTIPAGSIPELQSVQPVTVGLWFKTGFDGPLSR